MKTLILLGIFSAFVSSQKLFARTELDKKIFIEYLKTQKEFSDQSCRPGVEATYRELDKNYRDSGNFIPVTIDEKVDFKTIKNFIPLLKEKSNWIQSQIDFIKKNQDANVYKFEIDRLENDVSILLEARKEYFFAKDKAHQEDIKARAGRQFIQLLKEIEQFKKQAPFLLSFKFPVNHLSLRSEYEKYKNLKNNEARIRSNSIYFFRKIVQDGTYDEELEKNDSYVRSAFDTLYLALNKERNRNFLTDNERVDFRYVIGNFQKLLAIRTDLLINRFVEWKARNDRTLEFYQDLVSRSKIKISENSELKDVTSLLENRARALYTLKDFVLSREAFAYEFWSRKSELMQSLFAIETILYSEVGRMDGNDALERRDVAQIVINRAEHPEYNIPGKQDQILKYLPPKINIQDSRWLNVLFKEGEFSFTYFYIPGNLHIYCPDMSRVGQFLRRENIRIAMELLNKPRKGFRALRYFSRAGMFGRIEMDSLWEEFQALPEVPGKLVRKSRKVYDLYKRDQYKFLYHFKNEDLKKSFMVLELNGKPYVVDIKNPKQIYNYRSPHQFKYFSPLK